MGAVIRVVSHPMGGSSLNADCKGLLRHDAMATQLPQIESWYFPCRQEGCECPGDGPPCRGPRRYASRALTREDRSHPSIRTTHHSMNKFPHQTPPEEY